MSELKLRPPEEKTNPRAARLRRTGPTQANALRQIEDEHFRVLHSG